MLGSLNHFPPGVVFRRDNEDVAPALAPGGSMNARKRSALAAGGVLATAALLAACGGGGGGYADDYDANAAGLATVPGA